MAKTSGVNDEKLTTSVDSLVAQYSQPEQLKMLAEAQMSTITNLSKRIQSLEEENRKLKKDLSDNKKVLIPDNSLITLNSSNSGTQIAIEDEEQIAIMQIHRLRDMSLERDLTFEEAKKLDIYYKILSSIRNKPKVIEVKAKNFTDAELLSLVNSSSSEEE
jgi:ribosomal protein S15P/S13E